MRVFSQTSGFDSIQIRSRGRVDHGKLRLLSLIGFFVVVSSSVTSAISTASAQVPAQNPARQPASCWQVVESTNERLVIDIRVPNAEWKDHGATGGWYNLPGFGDIAEKDGRIFSSMILPVAIPPEGECKVSALIEHPYVLAKTYSDLYQDELTLSDQASPRWPWLTSRAPSESDVQFADPQGFVQVSEPGWGNHLRLIYLSINGVRPEANGKLISCGNIRITIDFPSAKATTERSSRFDKVQKQIVINPTQVSKWRHQLSSAPLRKTGDSFASATSEWIKIEISKRGFYQITIDDLNDLGIDPASVDLSQLRLFTGPGKELSMDAPLDEVPTWMEPVAILVENADGNQFTDETKIYFLANGPDAWLQDLGLPDDVGGDYRFYNHSYSNQRVYWLCWGGSFSTEPLWMASEPASPAGANLAETALKRLHVEKNRQYDHDIREEGVPWEKFFYAALDRDGINIRMELAGRVPETETHVRTCLWGNSWNGTATMSDHLAVVDLVDGDSTWTIGSAEWENMNHVVIESDYTKELTDIRLNLNIPRREVPQTGLAMIDASILAWIEVDYPLALETDVDSLDFFITPEAAAGDGFRIQGLGESDDWILIDGTDPHTPLILEPDLASESGLLKAEFRVQGGSIASHLTLLRRSDAASPERLTVREWTESRLRERSEAVDYLMVVADDLENEGVRLAEHRRQHFWGAAGDSAQDAVVVMATTSDVYDEFSFGMVDPTAIRNLAKFAYRFWRGGESEPVLSHLLLLGNALYDARGYYTGEPAGYLPSYFEYLWSNRLRERDTVYAADEWYTTLDDPDDIVPDIAIGRLPARTATEAGDIVDKVINYDLTPPAGDWKIKFVMAADDLCQGSNVDGLYQHPTQVDELCREHTPDDVTLDRIQLLEYGTECIYSKKPAATNYTVSTLSAGALIFNYIGHGSYLQLADERLLEASNLGALENREKPFLMITASCSVGKFVQNGDGFSLNAIRMAERGAIAVVSASAAANATPNGYMNNLFLDLLYPEGTVTKPVSIGAAYWIMKATSPSYLRDNNRTYNLFGDPGSRFASVDRQISMELIDVTSAPVIGDTLSRGSFLTLNGEVLEKGGETDSAYNGEVEVKIFDSELVRHWIHYGNQSVHEGDYHLSGANILTITTDVMNGAFTVPFMVPQTLLRGTRGPARIQAFARSDLSESDEACGAIANLQISDESEPITDSQPPEITLLWEAGEDVVEPGSKLEASLFDSSGIYIAALTPARSVQVIIVDQDEKIILTEDISTSVVFGTDYRRATVDYILPEWLPKNTSLSLSLSASDNVGQRATESVEFSILGEFISEQKIIEQVFLMPNPMAGEGHFMLELLQEADIELDIYTASGRKIVEIESPGMDRAYGRDVGIVWDGRDDDGDPVANGLYFYCITATGSSGASEELIERLVVFR